MTLDDTSGDKNRDFPGTIQEISSKSRILPNSRTRILVLRTHIGGRCAPMPEIGPWRTTECAVCAQWGIGVRQFGGGGAKSGGTRRCSSDMGPDFRLGEPDQGGQLPEGKLVLTPELLGQPDPAGPIQPARIAGSEHLLASVSA